MIPADERVAQIQARYLRANSYGARMAAAGFHGVEITAQEQAGRQILLATLAREDIPYLLDLITIRTQQLEMSQAEVRVLRGDNCEEDGDGPCGVCLKCVRAELIRERDVLQQAYSAVRAELALRTQERDEANLRLQKLAAGTIDAINRAHGHGQEHTIADVNLGLIDDLIAPRLQALQAERDTARSELARLREALEAVTRGMDRAGDNGRSESACPWCNAVGSVRRFFHEQGCELVKARELLTPPAPPEGEARG